MSIICPLLQVFIIILFVRAVLSWFPQQPGTVLSQINDVLRTLTDWAVVPLRSIVPPAGMFDTAFIVLVFGLLILQSAIC